LSRRGRTSNEKSATGEDSALSYLWHHGRYTVATQLLMTTLTLVDMYWVGQIGAVADPQAGRDAIGAVGVAARIIFIVMTLAMGLVTGSLALISRHVGGGDVRGANRVLTQSTMMIVVLSTALGTAAYFLAYPLIGLIKPAPEILDESVAYLRIIVGGALFMFLSFHFTVALQAAGDARTPFYIAVFTVLLNATLDPVLIFGLGPFPRLGPGGAAAASVTARIFAVAAAVLVLARGSLMLKFAREGRTPTFAVFREIMAIGIPNSLRMMCHAFAGVLMTKLVVGFGSSPLAAYSIGNNLQSLPMFVGFGLGRTSGVIVGQNLAAGNHRKAETGAWTTAAIFGGLMLLMGLAYFACAPHIIRWFNPLSAVVDVGTRMLRITTWGYLFIGVSIVLGKSLEGAGKTVAPLVITVVAIFGVTLPLAWYFAHPAGWGVSGIWWGMLLGSFVHGGGAILYFKLGGWKRTPSLSRTGE